MKSALVASNSFNFPKNSSLLAAKFFKNERPSDGTMAKSTQKLLLSFTTTPPLQYSLRSLLFFVENRSFFCSGDCGSCLSLETEDTKKSAYCLSLAICTKASSNKSSKSENCPTSFEKVKLFVASDE
uniref:Uncharacterized protein n=1 Tax=Romanomermis culicivorax TaxID=13658 RepID=A0A915KMI9_ROMCU